MRSDIVIEGENAEIFKDLINNEIYQSNVDIFFDALLIGLLESKKGEATPGDQNVETVEITRTWINNSSRSNFKTLISNFINLELQKQEEPLNIQDVFLDEEGTNSTKVVQLMKKYAYYGIQKLKRIYFEEQQLEDTLDYLNYVSDNIKVKSEIDYKNYYQEDNEEDIFEILNEME
ncbi:hypothetical protein ACMG5P_03635 [Staphylococcus haemolyticus]|uniref:hypothetical protein n=1 Tax=Staphylococcus haemolyticus TaxID=1283 RepID=UPI003CF5A1BF